MNAKSLRRPLILGVVLIACVALTVSILSGISRRAELENEIREYETVLIPAKQDENSEKKEALESGDMSGYAAEVARDKLGYGDSNEKVYYNITGK